VLEALPSDYPDRAKYEKLLAELCAALAATQGKDGLWRASLLDPESYPMGETSGSTFFCYGIAWAINHGIVDREQYLPVARKAWHALTACVEEDGKLGYVQFPADSPRSPTARGNNWEYASGAFLAAGAEMLKLLK
jgi:rhamnogalacturonyl hydrolase YesR